MDCTVADPPASNLFDGRTVRKSSPQEDSPNETSITAAMYSMFFFIVFYFVGLECYACSE
ncbi:hypothetical protein Barb7_02553 [Bacteroidales bacterium Barb7]|nr:hypothetical protein Barb7_02553 [Bacteroidales bacterium Barb7]